MSVPNREFFQHASGWTYDPTLYGSYGYDPAWLLPVPLPTVSAKPAEAAADNKELVELNVPFCCDGCVKKVSKKLTFLEGVGSVKCEVENHKVVVTGPAKPQDVLKEVRKIKHLQRAELWKKPKK